MASFLDKVGLSYFYGKIKAKLDKKLDKNLGVANKDKYLAINNLGDVEAKILPDQSFKATVATQLPTTAKENQVYILPLEENNEIKHYIDIIYPVGSYYETSNVTFNPNEAWGGTEWVEDTKGKMLVAIDKDIVDFNVVNKVGGEKEHILSINEIPSHQHRMSLANYSGTDNVSGVVWTTTAAKKYIYSHDMVEPIGGGLAHNNMPPYVVVKRWHRTK